MRIAWASAACMIGIVLLLPGCLVTPGAFESSLDIRADRSFSFAYKGQVIASDMEGSAGLETLDGAEDPLGGPMPDGEQSAYSTALLWEWTEQGKQAGPDARSPAPEERFDGEDGARADDDARMQAIAAALLKEKGFRAARYMGRRMFEIDYAIDGALTHAFLFPFNIDARIVLPFVAVEMRGPDRVRVKAPGYANSEDKGRALMGAGPDEAAAKALNGTFTLTTDATIVSQNQEEGATDGPRGKQLRWTVTSLTSEAPMAVLQFPAR